MKEGACIQSVIEILHSWDTQRFPLDRLCQQYFRNKRYMGSKDRQRVSNLVYNVMRNWGSLSWWTEKVGLPPTSRSLVLIHLKNKGIEKLFTGDLYHPEAPSVQEKKALQNSSKIQAGKNLPLSIQLNYPSWMETSLQNTFPHDFEQEMEALCQSAPFDLRVNPLLQTRESVQKELTHQGYETDLTSYSPYGLRSWKRFPLDQLSVFKRGAVEVQDESSQLVCLLSQVKPSHQVLDLCAGAGGKSLLLGALMKNKGHITATDIHDKRLKKCRDRLKRAKVQNTHCQVIDSENDAKLDSLKGKMDRVLVDAPCSGSGTWRRNPDLKWRTSPQDLKELVQKQEKLLKAAARYVKPGGWLIYATCSILDEENTHQIDKFIREVPEFNVYSMERIYETLKEGKLEKVLQEPYLRLSPFKTGTDGFFAAILEKKLSV